MNDEMYYNIIKNGYIKFVKTKNLEELKEILDNVLISQKFVNDNQDKYKNVLKYEIDLYNYQKNILENEIKIMSTKEITKKNTKNELYNINKKSKGKMLSPPEICRQFAKIN